MDAKLVLDILKKDTYSKKFDPRLYNQDRLPLKLKKNRIYVIHSSSSRQKPSKKNGNLIFGHFLAIDTLRLNKKTKNKKKSSIHICLFDSYGRFSTLPYERIKKVIQYNINRGADFSFNNICYQPKKTTVCGSYTIYYLLMRSRGHSLKNIQLHKFSSNNRTNLKYIPSLIEKLLPKTAQKSRLYKTRFNLDVLTNV